MNKKENKKKSCLCSIVESGHSRSQQIKGNLLPLCFAMTFQYNLNQVTTEVRFLSKCFIPLLKSRYFLRICHIRDFFSRIGQSLGIWELMHVLLCVSFNCFLKFMKSEFYLSLVLCLYFEFVSTFIVPSELQTIFSHLESSSW